MRTSCKILIAACLLGVLCPSQTTAFRQWSKPFFTPKCGHRFLHWIRVNYHVKLPHRLLLHVPLNYRQARKWGRTPGCKFPFHNAMHECCRQNAGDCTGVTVDKMLASSRTLHQCLHKHRGQLRQCWIEAEKGNACPRSDRGHVFMKRVNNGVTW